MSQKWTVRRALRPASWLGRVGACGAAIAAGPAFAQVAGPSAAASAPLPAQQVTVTATRIAEPAFDVPASIDRISVSPDADGRPGINISESLAGVPGLLARDRQNYAQDVQISVRGFGTRSTFGIRGVRLYVDGIPGTLPDGQGQISNVDLGSAAAVEVLRGPFSALYGNSSGGVLSITTQDGEGPPRLTIGAGTGTQGRQRYEMKLSGAQGAFDYVVSGSHFSTDGYRDHSSVQRDLENVKLGLAMGDAGKLTLVGNAIDMPLAQDPLGLSRAEMEADRHGVDPSALQFDTRKTLSQQQLGLVWEKRFADAGELRALVYGGQRATTQFQAIPVASQANPLSPGGVIGLARDYEGTDLRWTSEFAPASQRLLLVAGLAWDALREHRRGYENYVGTTADPTTGVQGPLRRDEINDVHDLDPYAQLEWHPDARWTLEAGVRRSSVRFASHDHYVTDTNPDDSGAVNYTATLPVAGAMFALSPSTHLYATAGRGFETPTLNELAYRPDGLSGLNLALRPSHSDNLEAGVKFQSGDWGVLNASAFVTHTHDEIVTLANTGGRSTYQNVAATRRRGLELEWTKPLPHDLNASLAYTLIDARYTDAFETCVASPCATPNVPVAAGSRLPGLARNTAYAALAWQPPQGWRTSVDVQALSRVEVNDTNTDAAAAYAIAGASVGWQMPWREWRFNGFARVDNLLGRRYVGSVIVNEGNSRFFEPAPGRTLFAGISATCMF